MTYVPPVLPDRQGCVSIERIAAAARSARLLALAAACTLAMAGSARAAPVIATAGDIACDPGNSNFNGGNGSTSSCRDKYTSDLIVNNPSVAAVLPLGDNQYYCGGFGAFQASYDLSWGRLKSITYPSVGNHEYITSGGTGCDASNTGAAGYFQYFGAAAGDPKKGYYSYDIGTWHLIALNSQCSTAGGCGSSTAQGQWLRADLAAHTNQCLLAYWHIPLFSSGGRANNNTRSFWDALYAAKADVILSAHDHIYERFAPQTPTGAPDPANGIREFIAGTGGANHTSLATLAANSEILNTNTFGVLELTLYPDQYTWQFVPEAGRSFTDAGSQSCHKGAPTTPDTTPPSAPANLTTRAVSANQVDLSWGASTDDRGVSGYKIFRGSSQIATATGPSYADTSTQPNTTYQYHVVANDFANNSSGASNTVSVTTPAPATVLTFTPTADTYAAADGPSTVYGTSTQFIADNSPVKRLFTKFSVSGVGTKRVVAAKLRLYCVNPSPSGGAFHGSDPAWSESTLTWNLQPAIDSTIVSSLGAVRSSNWYETDVTALVKGDGTVSIAATSTSSDGAYYSSKEGTAGFAPQLVVTTG
jgi:acid phosphatase type 7